MLGSNSRKTDLIITLVTNQVVLVLAVPDLTVPCSLWGSPKSARGPGSHLSPQGCQPLLQGLHGSCSPAPHCLALPTHGPCKARLMSCLASAHPCGHVWIFWGYVWPWSSCWAWPWPPRVFWCPAWPQPIPGPMEVPSALSSACPCPAIEFRVTSLGQI